MLMLVSVHDQVIKKRKISKCQRYPFMNGDILVLTTVTLEYAGIFVYKYSKNHFWHHLT